MKKENVEEITKKILDERAEQLPGQVKSTLSQARYSALKSAGAHKNSRSSWGWGGVAMVASIALVVVMWQPNSSFYTGDVFAFEDMDLMMADDELELYEDLDFIAWLDDIEGAG